MTQLQEKQEERVRAADAARKKAMAKANTFAEVLFENPQGREVMQEIKDQFDLESLYGGNQFDTVYKAAQRDVVRWIEEVIYRGNNNVER